MSQPPRCTAWLGFSSNPKIPQISPRQLTGRAITRNNWHARAAPFAPNLKQIRVFEELGDMDAVARRSEARMKPMMESWGEHLKPLPLPPLPTAHLLPFFFPNYNYD